jgi:hypothetical protein
MNAETNTTPRWIRLVWNWLKGWMQRHKIISGLVLIYAVWQVVMTPIFNPFASDAYTIRGRFPFDQGFELQFIQNAYGNSTWYRRWCGGIQTDNAICRAGHRVLKPTRLEGQNYEIKIYRDRYFFGLADWQEESWHVEYKANMGLDPMKVMAHAYANDENSACNGSEESTKRHEGRLFCVGHINDKDYKHLVINEGLPLKPNEQLMNFWLYTELDAMTVKEKSQ